MAFSPNSPQGDQDRQPGLAVGSSRALITGAGSGMGLATAIHLAGRNWRVWGSVLNDAEAAHLARAATEAGVKVEIIHMDVTDQRQITVGVSQMLAREGGIDALVGFAGIGLRGFIEDLSLDEVRHAHDVNLLGALRLIQAVLPTMRKARRGRIVLTTSVAGRMASMSIGGYASSKFALEGLGECLAQEVAPFGIKVSLLEPGLVLTEHFTRDRNRAKRALDPSGPYYAWFCQHEKIVDDLLARNRMSPMTVAHRVERILATRRPRLRYVVGGKARMILALRRYSPGDWFERFYFRLVRRMVTEPRHPAQGLSGSAMDQEPMSEEATNRSHQS